MNTLELGDILVWFRVMGYLLLAVMLSYAGTIAFRPAMRRGLWATGFFMGLASIGALMAGIKLLDWRDALLNIQSVYIVIVIIIWAHSISKMDHRN